MLVPVLVECQRSEVSAQAKGVGARRCGALQVKGYGIIVLRPFAHISGFFSWDHLLRGHHL